MNKREEFNESLRDIIVGHRKMGDVLKWSGIKPTEENINRFFPYRNVGCPGLVCPTCGSIRLWIVKKNFRADFSKIDVDVYRCIDCDEESSFYYNSYRGCYEDPDRAEAWMEDQADDIQNAIMDSQAEDIQC